MDKPILVTGGLGFLGRNICGELEAEHIVIDKEECKEKNYMNIDILDHRTLYDKCQDISKIVHLAAIVGVPFSTKNPKITWEVNSTGTLNLLELARRRDVDRFVYASSNAVYGEYPALEKGITEDFRKKPTNIYAASKLAGERLVSLYSELYGLNTISLRFSNAYGPRQNESNVIWIFIKKAFQGDKIVIFGNGDSGRDFTYIKDIVNGTLLAINSDKTGIYNMASGKTTTIKQVADIIKSNFPGLEIEYAPARVGDASQGALNIDKAKRDLSYSPKIDIKQGIKECIDWYKKTN